MTPSRELPEAPATAIATGSLPLSGTSVAPMLAGRSGLTLLNFAIDCIGRPCLAHRFQEEQHFRKTRAAGQSRTRHSNAIARSRASCEQMLLQTGAPLRRACIRPFKQPLIARQAFHSFESLSCCCHDRASGPHCCSVILRRPYQRKASEQSPCAAPCPAHENASPTAETMHRVLRVAPLFGGTSMPLATSASQCPPQVRLQPGTGLYRWLAGMMGLFSLSERQTWCICSCERCK